MSDGKTENNAPVQETPSEGQSQIPEKFKGKSPEEILKSYQELESELGRLRNEYGTTRRERDEAFARYQQMEQYLASLKEQQRTEQVSDPFSVLDQYFDEDPKRAFKEALKKQQELLATQTQQQILQIKKAQLEKTINEARANPDFARREALMQQLVLRFSSLLNPQQLTNPEVIDLLDLASKGADINYYEQQAVERARKNGLSTRDEKLGARSESGAPSAATVEDPLSLSIAELEKRLKVKDD